MSGSVKQVKNHWLRRSWDQGGESTSIILLNSHVVKLPSKSSCLYPQTNDVFHLHQRRFLLKLM